MGKVVGFIPIRLEKKKVTVVGDININNNISNNNTSLI